MFKIIKINTLFDLSQGRNNNFNLLRFIAASLVIYSHSFALLKGGGTDPLGNILGFGLAGIAVDTFFVISGFLIVRSYLRHNNLFVYLRARALRILPGLFVALLFCVLVIGPIYTQLRTEEYFSDNRVYNFFISNFTMIQRYPVLPGVFTENPARNVNGSLWTLGYEASMYLAVAVLGIAGILASKRGVTIFFVLYFLLYVLASIYPGFAQTITSLTPLTLIKVKRLTLFFVLGALFYIARKKIALHIYGVFIFGLLAFFCFGSRYFYFSYSIFLAYFVMWLAFVPRGLLLKFNKLDDYSYGIYIYAFPVQQALIASEPEITVATLCATSYILTLMCALFSAQYVEKPALQINSRWQGASISQLQDYTFDKTESKPENPATAKIGVMLVNLGTPDAPDRDSVKRYLGEFLSDRRVIEIHPILWWPLLHGFILPLRSTRVAQAYHKIWRNDGNESPLRYFTRRQSERLGERFQQLNPQIIVDWAMRYGTPSIADRFAILREQGCTRILVAPLYPQYSATTTATVIDKIFESLRKIRDQPALRTLPPYYEQAGYIEALATSVEKYLDNCATKPDTLLASFHGLPQANIEAGDPYYRHCATTTRLLRERLAMDENFLRMTFQSRFGPAQWLKPSTDQTLIELAQGGIRNVALFTPGFAADCLETLEEIAIRNRELFLARGGRNYDYIPCLNDSPAAIEMLAAMIEQELSGWI